MSIVRKQNQVHPLLPKKKRVDALGNSKKRVWVRSGTSTMLLCKGITTEAARVLINSIQDNANKLGTTIECSFTITQ